MDQRHFDEDEVLKGYLSWVVTQHQYLTLLGSFSKESPTLVQVPLEKVYVALRCLACSPYEKETSKTLFEKELTQMYGSQWEELPLEEKYQLRSQYLAQYAPYMQSISERDRTGGSFDLNLRMSIGEVMKKERKLVILGDPGSGKTTLARWIALKSALAMQNGESHVVVPAHQVDSSSEIYDQEVNLGPTRLPILIHISEYSQSWQQYPNLLDFLGRNTWMNHAPTFQTDSDNRSIIPKDEVNYLMRKYLRQQNAIVILDGLDEITDLQLRDEVINSIQNFVTEYVNDKKDVSEGGNQLVVTSRIVGYHSRPLLRGLLTHVTVEPMDNNAISHFCEAWVDAFIGKSDKIEVPVVSTESDLPSELWMHIFSYLSPDDLLVAQAVCRAWRFLVSTDDQYLAILQRSKEARELEAAIMNRNRPGLRELAGNPLLLSVIAMIYTSTKQLPDNRSKLYGLAMQYMIKRWSERIVSSQKNLVMNEEEIEKVLAPVAAFIHDTYSSGLIPETQLIKLITAELASVRKQSEETAASAVHEFLEVIKTSLGIIMERGEGTYGFVHLSFQEYLSGRYIVQNEDNAFSNIVDRISHPRWREAIVLGLGYASSHWNMKSFEQLLSKLLTMEDSIKKFIPRVAFVLVKAMSDIERIPELPAHQLVLTLLTAYADRLLYSFVPMRKQLENAFSTMLLKGSDLLLRALEQVFTSVLVKPPSPDIAPAAASIISAIGWYTPKIVERLLEAIPNDSAAWGWPIDSALRRFLTNLVTKPREPSYYKDLRKLQVKALKEKSDSERGQIRAQISALKRRNLSSELVYLKKKDAYDRVVKLRTCSSLPLIPKAQQFLNEHKEAMQWIRRAPDLFRALVATVHGFRDYDSQSSLSEYMNLSSWLQLDEFERAPYEMLFAEQYGYTLDTAYQLAIHLDTYSEKQFWQVKPEFNPSAIYMDTALSSKILEVANTKDIASLNLELWKLWKGKNTATKKSSWFQFWAKKGPKGGTNESNSIAFDPAQVEAFMALCALGEDVGFELKSLIMQKKKLNLVKEIEAKLSRTVARLKDPVTRSIRHIVEPLKLLVNVIPSYQWGDVVRAAVELTYVNGGTIFDLSSLLRVCPDSELSYVMAEYLIVKVSGSLGEDCVYDAAIAADCLEELCKTSPVLYTKAISSMYRSQYLKLYPDQQYGWAVEYLAPILPDEEDIMVDFLFSLENLHPDMRIFIGPELNFIRNHTSVDSSFEVIWGISYLSLRGNRSEANWSNITEDFVRLVEDSRAITDHFRRSMCMSQLAFHFHDYEEQLLLQALSAARFVENPLLRTRALEKILFFKNCSVVTSQLVKEAIGSARKIESFNNRCRALTRLSFHLPAHERKGLLSEALGALDKVQDEHNKAEILCLLRSQLVTEPDLYAASWEIAEKIKDKWCNAKAKNQLSYFLMSVHRQVPEAYSDLWAALTLCAQVQDVRKLCGFTTDSLDLSGLLVPSEQSSLLNDIEQKYQSKGIVLSRSVAVVLEKLIDTQQMTAVHRVMPFLKRPEPEVWPIVWNWLQSKDHTVRSYASLLLAEHQGPTNTTFPGLLDCLESKDDLAYRRALFIFDGSAGVENDHRSYSVKTLGISFVNKLLESRYKHKNNVRISSALTWIFHCNVIHDDADAVNLWMKNLSAADKEVRETAQLAEYLAVRPAAWTAFLNGLKNVKGDPLENLLHDICTMVYVKGALLKRKTSFTNIPRTGLDDLAQTLCSLDPNELSKFKVLLNGTDDLFKAAQESLRLSNNDPYQASSIANEQLDMLGVTYKEIFSQKPKDLIASIERIGVNSIWYFHNIYKKIVHLLAQMEKESAIFWTVLIWMKNSLAAFQYDEIPRKSESLKIVHLMILSSGGAQRMPASFIHCANEIGLTGEMLEKAVRSFKGYVVRRSALVLLSLLRHETVRYMQAIRWVARDPAFRVEDVVSSIKRLQGLERQDEHHAMVNIGKEILSCHAEESCLVTLAISNILTCIGQNNPKLAPEIMKIIADILEKLSGPARFLYVQYSGMRIPKVSSLREILYQSLVQMSSIVDTPQQPPSMHEESSYSPGKELSELLKYWGESHLDVAKDIMKEHFWKTDAARFTELVKELQFAKDLTEPTLDSWKFVHSSLIDVYTQRAANVSSEDQKALLLDQCVDLFLAFLEPSSTQYLETKDVDSFACRFYEVLYQAALSKVAMEDYHGAIKYHLLRIEHEGEKFINKMHAQNILEIFSYSDFKETLQLYTASPAHTELYMRGLISLSDANLLEAQRLFSLVTSLNKDHVPALLCKAEIHRKKKVLDKADRKLHRVLAAMQKDQNQELKAKVEPNVYYLQSLIAKSESNTEAAIELTTKCLALLPTCQLALHHRGQLYFNEGMLHEALADFETLLTLNPLDHTAKTSKGSIHVLLGNLDYAKEEMTLAIKMRDKQSDHNDVKL